MSSTSPSPAPALGYWAASKRPLASLVFIAPFLAAYEGGVLWFGAQAVHNGVAVWLRQFLGLLGFGQYFLLPVLVCAVLLAWHHVSHQPWSVSPRVLSGMCLEAAALAVALWLVACAQGWLFGRLSLSVPCAVETGHYGPQIVAYCGAGIYEELLFRLLLLPAAAALVHFAGVSRKHSFMAAVAFTSLLFSLAHYRLFSSSGDAFVWFTFCFRFLAGVFFAVLFLFRGFGVTAGAHALYDILTAAVSALAGAAH